MRTKRAVKSNEYSAKSFRTSVNQASASPPIAGISASVSQPVDKTINGSRSTVYTDERLTMDNTDSSLQVPFLRGEKVHYRIHTSQSSSSHRPFLTNRNFVPITSTFNSTF